MTTHDTINKVLDDAENQLVNDALSSHPLKAVDVRSAFAKLRAAISPSPAVEGDAISASKHSKSLARAWSAFIGVVFDEYESEPDGPYKDELGDMLSKVAERITTPRAGASRLSASSAAAPPISVPRADVLADDEVIIRAEKECFSAFSLRSPSQREVLLREALRDVLSLIAAARAANAEATQTGADHAHK